jgi:hypothetical protein
MPWKPELSHDEYIERNLKRRCDLESNRHTAAGKREDDYIVSSGILAQFPRQTSSRVATIPKARSHITPLVSLARDRARFLPHRWWMIRTWES